MSTLIAENFDATTVGSLPSGWTNNAQNAWSVQTASGGLSGRVLRSTTKSVAATVTKTFTAQTSGTITVAFKFRTPASLPSGYRCFDFYLYNSGIQRHRLIQVTTGMYVDGTTSIGVTLATNTDYQVIANVDLSANKVLRYIVNGTTYDNGGAGWACASSGGIDTVVFDAYSPSFVGVNQQIDEVVALTGSYSSIPSSAPSAGTLAGSGTVNGVACGPTMYGDHVLMFTAGASAPTSLTVERSTDGSTWADCSSLCKITDQGGGYWKVRVRRTTYGSQSAAIGSTFQYRVTPANVWGSGSTTSAVTPAATYLDREAIKDANLAVIDAAFTAAGGTIPSSVSGGTVYPGYALLTSAWGYYRSVRAGSAITQRLTNAMAQLSYIQTLCNADDLLQLPDYTDQLYLDHHGRTALQIAVAARLLRYAGATSEAATLLAQADAMAQAIFDHLNGGSPTYTLSVSGYDANSQTAYSTGTVTVGTIRRPTSANGRSYRAMSANGSTTYGASGSTGASEPTWPTTTGGTVTDGQIVWRETGASGTTLLRLHQDVAPYTANSTAGANDFDMNQLVEQAALLSMLVTDTASVFYPTGTYRTKALDVISGTCSVMTAYQASGGKITLGYTTVNNSAYGSGQYDTLYGGYTLDTLSIIKHLLGDQHPAMTLFIYAGRAWLDGTYSTEPITGNHYSGGTYVLFSELAYRVSAADLFDETTSIEPLLFQDCLWDPATNKITDGYAVDGSGSPHPSDAVQVAYWEPYAIIDGVISVVDLDASGGSATASGGTASVSITLTAASGTATAQGGTAAPSYTLDASAGTASATGGTATLTISSSTDLTATGGYATAQGGTVAVSVTLTATGGTATATGGTATLAVSGGGSPSADRIAWRSDPRTATFSTTGQRTATFHTPGARTATFHTPGDRS